MYMNLYLEHKISFTSTAANVLENMMRYIIDSFQKNSAKLCTGAQDALRKGCVYGCIVGQKPFSLNILME